MKYWKKKTWKNLKYAMALPVCALALGCTGHVQGAGENAPPVQPAAGGGVPPALPVKIQVAKMEKVGESSKSVATLRSRNSAVLMPQVEGNVTRIFVHSGEHVKAGAPLLEIDPVKQEATLKNQEATQRARAANLEWARTDLSRKKELFAAGVISRQEVEQAQTAFDAAQATLESMEAGVHEQQLQLRYYKVKAPEAGIIGDIPVRVGERVATTTMLTTLDKVGALEAYIYIPPSQAAAVHPGTAVEILGEDGKPVTRAAVSFISPRVDPAQSLLLVKANVPNTDRRYRNEQKVDVLVIWDQVQRPTVPVTAVTRISGQTFAYVADSEGKQTVARQRSVHLGDIVGNDYVVLDGIQSGDKIIVSGVQMLTDGMPVAPQT